MANTGNEDQRAGAPSGLNGGLERDRLRNEFYKGADRGDPLHWRDIGPDEVWNAAWEAAIKAELNTCVMICDDIARNGKGGAPTCVRALRERANMELSGREEEL